MQGAVTKLANRLQRRHMAQQNRSWDFDQEEGLLDSDRLSRIIAKPPHSPSYKVEPDTDFPASAVTLRIANSGSIRGRTIYIETNPTKAINSRLAPCGVQAETEARTPIQHN